MRKKLFKLLSGGYIVPRCIRCYATKRNPAQDCITIVYTHANEHSGKHYIGRVVYRTYSFKPYHPLGFAQWGDADRRRFYAGGSRVDFIDLPPGVQICVIKDYAGLWGYRCRVVGVGKGWRITYFDKKGVK